MRAVDTNVLVRLATRDDERQVEFADAFVARGAWASLLALAEMTWVLRASYGLDHAGIATAVAMFLNHETITVQDADVAQAALEHYRRRPALGYSDCLLLEIARKAGHLPLATFDKALAKIDGAQKL